MSEMNADCRIKPAYHRAVLSSATFAATAAAVAADAAAAVQRRARLPVRSSVRNCWLRLRMMETEHDRGGCHVPDCTSALLRLQRLPLEPAQHHQHQQQSISLSDEGALKAAETVVVYSNI